MAEILQMYNSIPLFTRHWFGASLAFPLAVKLGVLKASSLILTPDFLSRLELWRPITATFFYPVSFHYLMNLFFLYNYSSRLETVHFLGKPAEYLFMLLFSWFATFVMCYFTGVMVMMDILVLSVIYVWSQFNREAIVTFWFGLKFKALYFPWVLLAFNALVGGSGLYEIMGIIVGHLYYFIMHKYPESNNGNMLISTPSILYDYFPTTPMRAGFNFYEARPSPQQAPAPSSRLDPFSGRRLFGGTGHRLGS